MTTINETTKIRLSEEDVKNLIRNTLLIAGEEMGEDGDHWPVIEETIKDIMHDWEELEIERAVHAEMKKHLYEQLAIMQETLKTCSTEVKGDLAPRLAELKEVYDAFFTEVHEDVIYLADEEDELYLADEEEKPLHIRRAEAIIDTLEEKQDV
jgi:acid stress-induced BolA-like protein IbaG/YrbA